MSGNGSSGMGDGFGFGGSDSFGFGGSGFMDPSSPLMYGALYDDCDDAGSYSPGRPDSTRSIRSGGRKKEKPMSRISDIFNTIATVAGLIILAVIVLGVLGFVFRLLLLAMV